MTDETQVQQAEPRTKVLANGAIYDLDKGRIVANPGGGSKAITPELSSAYHARRLELKRQRLLAGAAKTLERSGEWSTPDDLDVVEAIGEAVMIKAMNPDNAKQVDAARFVLQEAGLAESQAPTTQNNTINVMAMPEDVAAALIELRQRLSAPSEPVLPVLDAESALSASNTSRQAVRIAEQDTGSPTGSNDPAEAAE